MKFKSIYFIAFITCLLASISTSFAQEEPAKVKHAEPLYLDLMRDLGARKGEAEFNVGYGRALYKNSKEHNSFLEYEWAPINRLGFEVEVPLSFNKERNTHKHEKVEGIKVGGQYTFFVSEKQQTSLAVGYMQEFEFIQSNINQPSINAFKGFVYSPFFVAAKNFNKLSTMLYVAPFISHDKLENLTQTDWTLNGSIHYTLPHSGHFIGVENNINIRNGEVDYVMRPQIKIALAHNFAVGILSGIPIHSKNMDMDFMTRVIWEPNFHKH